MERVRGRGGGHARVTRDFKWQTTAIPTGFNTIPTGFFLFLLFYELVYLQSIPSGFAGSFLFV